MIVSLGERFGRAKAAFIRVNYGLQRHKGGGMAVRTIACLPALVGHWKHAGGGVQAPDSTNSSSSTPAALLSAVLNPDDPSVDMPNSSVVAAVVSTALTGYM